MDRNGTEADAVNPVAQATRLGALFAAWAAFWRRLEGPELEPPIWHSHFLTSHVARRALHEMGATLAGTVIDIGAGTGHGSAYLDGSRTTYVPTDLPDGRDASDTTISKHGMPVAHRCSVYELPFPDGHFGAGMMLMVLEHLEFPARGLAEVFRVIEPGGRFLISVPFAFPRHGAPDDYRRWTIDGLAAELRQAGFVVEHCTPCGGAFSSLALNLNLTWRYHVVQAGSRVTRALLLACLPLLFVTQTLTNLLALVLDPLDGSGALPLTIVALARKPEGDS